MTSFVKSRLLNVSLSFALFCAVTLSSLVVDVPDASARSSNWSAAERSNYCANRARRYADRNTRRTTAAGAVTGTAVGGVAGGNRRNAGRGALIGGGAGLVHSSARWNSIYDRYYRNCVRW